MEDRTLVSFVLGSLMVAEECITTKFSGLVGADASEEEVTWFSTRFMVREGLLPGCVAGYSKIHHDEHRHIEYGIRYLRQAVAQTPAMGDVVRATLSRAAARGR